MVKEIIGQIIAFSHISYSLSIHFLNPQEADDSRKQTSKVVNGKRKLPAKQKKILEEETEPYASDDSENMTLYELQQKNRRELVKKKLAPFVARKREQLLAKKKCSAKQSGKKFIAIICFSPDEAIDNIRKMTE